MERSVLMETASLDVFVDIINVTRRHWANQKCMLCISRRSPKVGEIDRKRVGERPVALGGLELRGRVNPTAIASKCIGCALESASA